MSALLPTMRGRVLSVLVGTALLPALASADQPPIPRIGVLMPQLENAPLQDGLPRGLHELGYSEGKNIIIDWRGSSGTDEEMRSIATDLARSKVDLIVAPGTAAARAAMKATTTIPVVFIVGDAVAAGLASSLARPGRNGTGLSVVGTELAPKRLELLHQAIPQARRIVYLMNSSNPMAPRLLEEARKGARTLGVQLVTLDARDQQGVNAALETISRGAGDGLLLTADFLFLAEKAKIVRAVREARVPAMFPGKEYRGDGVLMSYGPNVMEIFHRTAVYVDKILHGAKPAELPIEQSSTYELVIDLRAAHEQGINLPQELLLRADEVIR